MKKSIARGSVLAVATLSLMIGGVPSTSGVKEKVSQTPAIIGKAIENSTVKPNSLFKGAAIQQIAETKGAEQSAEEDISAKQDGVDEEVLEPAEVEVKEAKIENNQVVANIDSYLNIREEASEDADVVGKFYTGNVGTIVEKGDEWSLVSSGNAYGYVNNDYLLFGEAAENYIENNCDQIAKVTTDTLNIRAEESTDSEVVTLSDEGDALTVLGAENGWVKVAVTDEEVGYVASDYVYVDYVYETAVTIEEEEEAEAERIAEEQAAAEEAQRIAEEQAATESAEAESSETEYSETTYTEAPVTTEATVTEASEQETYELEESTSESSESTTGQAVADYAVQFVGNPYVYGGTSLTNGADCSGFVQSVYKHFGYSLSRTSQSQAGDGTAVSVDSLQPGDLLFYHDYGHVAIYIGGGQVVHASTAATGIKISSYDYSPIDKAVRIIN